MSESTDSGRWYPRNPMVGVGAVVIRDRSLLMVKRAQEPSLGKWSIPGGGVELGETLYEAVKREVFEECSVTIEIERLLDATENIIRDKNGRVKFHFVLVDFVGRYINGEVLAQSDAGECRWVDLKEVEGMDIPLTLHDVLKRNGII
ncbi:MAG: NUDIX hydrolase [Dehalococcoidales bacterium]